MFTGKRNKRITFLIAIGIISIVLLGVVLTNSSKQWQSGPGETAEDYALRFVRTYAKDRNRDGSIAMLCPEGLPQLLTNLEMRLDFWSSEEVTVPAYDLAVVRSVEHPPFYSAGRPVRKVWIAYKYAYNYQGLETVRQKTEGVPIYVTLLEDGYCASPWAGE